MNDPGEAGRGIPTGQPDGRTLKDAAEAALRLVVGQRGLGDVLAEQRVEVEVATRGRLQDILNEYNTGINVVSVELQDVQAPEEVATLSSTCFRPGRTKKPPSTRLKPTKTR